MKRHCERPSARLPCLSRWIGRTHEKRRAVPLVFSRPREGPGEARAVGAHQKVERSAFPLCHARPRLPTPLLLRSRLSRPAHYRWQARWGQDWRGQVRRGQIPIQDDEASGARAAPPKSGSDPGEPVSGAGAVGMRVSAGSAWLARAGNLVGARGQSACTCGQSGSEPDFV